MILPVREQRCSLVREAVVSLLLLEDGILCSLLSDGFSLSLHSALSIQSSFSVICFVAMLTCQVFIRQKIFTGIIDEIGW